MPAAKILHKADSVHRRILILSVFICLHSISCSSSTASKDDSGTGIKNFGRINEHYYRGGQPEAAGFAALKRLGIRTVIDLREDRLEEEARWVTSAGMRYFLIPLTGSRPATAAQTEYFLKLVNNPANWPVYVHCAAGRHRAGEMTAIYRITHDSWTADQAYAEMKKYGFYAFPNHGPLKDYVYEYYQSRSSAN